MKIVSLLLSLCLASVALADDPAELERLRKIWKNSQANAKKGAEDLYEKENLKANKFYYEELQQMKNNFMDAKNLKAAVAVDTELEKLKALHGKQKFEAPINGVWKVVYNNGETRTYSIKGNKITILKSSYRGVGETVELTRYAQGWLAKFSHVTEYMFLIDDKIYIHHWGADRMNYKTAVPANVAMGIRE